MPDYHTFETERLFLKPMTEEDAEFLLELLNTPKWLQYIGDRNVKSVEAAKEYIANRVTPQLEKLGFSNCTVIRKSDGKKLGACGLYDREGLEGIDLGFAFLPEYEGMGYGFEAAEKIKEAAFKVFNIKELSGITTKDNVASQKLLTKLGFKFVKMVTIPNDEEELMLYQLSAL